MSVYDLHFNKDDVTIRNILIGCLATLHENMFWYNQVGSDVSERRLVKVPFYFSTTGTERYLQDNFLNNIDFDPENLQAETFYNTIPRGIVDLTGISVEAQNIVNKYIRMNHQVQEEDGTLNTYNTEAFWVPIVLDLDIKVYTDSILDQLKCTEAIIKAFFKSKAYQVDVAYTRIPSLIVFPDEYGNERTIEFSFTDKREFVTTFSLQIKSHIPIFKPETTIFAGTTMEGFEASTYVTPVQYGSTSTSSNTGAPNPHGSIGLKFGNPIPDTPSWPIKNPSAFPPDGGATSSNQ
jgi:hypothetical protein